MTANVCPSCLAQQDAGLLCSRCCDLLERDLGDVPAIVADLDITLSRQARLGAGGKSGVMPNHRDGYHQGASLAAGVLGNVLTTWVRDITGDQWRPALGVNPTTAAAGHLLMEIPAVRKHPAVEELVDQITDAVRQARHAVDRPADKVYLGQCLVNNPDGEGGQVTCYAELYARPDARETTCRICGVCHEVSERRAWLLRRAEDMLFTVQQAAQMVGDVGHIKVTEAAIRGYIHRKRITYRPGGKLIRLGDLLAVVLAEGEKKSA